MATIQIINFAYLLLVRPIEDLKDLLIEILNEVIFLVLIVIILINRNSEKNWSNLSGIDPVWPLLAEHLEDDAAEVTAEGTDGLVVSLSFGALFLVVALRLRDPFAMVIDGGHHRRLGAGVDVLWRL